MKKIFTNCFGETIGKEEFVNEKIQIMQELKMFQKTWQVEAVRKIFNRKETEIQIENLMHDLMTRKISVGRFIDVYY